jgi:LmbE family N-acetylglucosaminyl deacetylase
MSLLGRLLVVSPHLDDAVFGCGELLATYQGCVVVTVFAGWSNPLRPPTAWDAAAGFGPGDDVVRARRAEDRVALERLAAKPRWLEFLDRQYAPSPPAESVARVLREVLHVDAPSTVMLPLGLFHTDHLLASDACIQLMHADRERQWFAYEDAMYRRLPGLVQKRMAALLARDVHATPLHLLFTRQLERKRSAVDCYASQLRALSAFGAPGYQDVFTAESYWRLSVPS